MTKSIIDCFRKMPASVLLPAALLVLAGGCATGQPKAEITHQRGWIGGEYKLAQPARFWRSPDVVYAFPKSLRGTQQAGILVTALSSNTPARLAGLREGDLILELDHHPVTDMGGFRRTIDQAAPGSLLPVKAWRDGQTAEYDVPVGRETFKNYGSVSLGVMLRDPDLSFNPGFSLVAAGYDPPGQSRKELGSVKSTYVRNSDGGKYEPTEQEWAAWLAVFRVAKGKTILAQEMVPARASAQDP